MAAKICHSVQDYESNPTVFSAVSNDVKQTERYSKASGLFSISGYDSRVIPVTNLTARRIMPYLVTMMQFSSLSKMT